MLITTQLSVAYDPRGAGKSANLRVWAALDLAPLKGDSGDTDFVAALADVSAEQLRDFERGSADVDLSVVAAAMTVLGKLWTTKARQIVQLGLEIEVLGWVTGSECNILRTLDSKAYTELRVPPTLLSTFVPSIVYAVLSTATESCIWLMGKKPKYLGKKLFKNTISETAKGQMEKAFRCLIL